MGICIPMITLEWIIGFVWGVGTISDGRLYIRYHNKELLQVIAEVIGTKARPYHPTEGKTALRFSHSNILSQNLLRLGWTGRFDSNRKYPIGLKNELDFIQGYCFTKLSYGLRAHKNRKGEIIKTPHIRIYGSYDIVCNIDNYLISELKTTPKKPALHKTHTQDGYTGECWFVQYQSQKEVPLIMDFIKPIRERQL